MSKYLDYAGVSKLIQLIKNALAGFVSGPSSSTNAHIATFNGTTGKVLKDSGFTIGVSVPANAKFTDNNTTYKLTIGSTTNGDSNNGVSLGTLTRGSAASGGTTLSLVNTGDMYNWNNKQAAITATGLLKGSGSSVSSAVAGTDYVAPVSGKGLSTNDFTAALKKKVDNVQNLTSSSTTSGSITLTSNTFYSLGSLTGALTVTLGTTVSGLPNLYSMEFDVINTSYVPSFPSDIKWSSDVTWAADMHYEVNIRYDAKTFKYYGIIAEFEIA